MVLANDRLLTPGTDLLAAAAVCLQRFRVHSPGLVRWAAMKDAKLPFWWFE